ncbi:MAG: ankyrin repeat domain-containing protein [Deltaproteobacteria bacterium]|nr:ankyrin repeat domain-containing protein [Deltaproteobacteria bacterium]
MKRIIGFFLILSMLILLASCATPLMNAAGSGDINAVKELVNKGADVNEKYNALIAAALNGHTEIVKLFIDKGADVNAKSNALIAAARYGHTEIVKLLIDKGADVNVKSWNDVPVVWVAAYFGHTEIVKLLIDKGADIDYAITMFKGESSAAAQLLERMRPKQQIASPTQSQGISKEELKTIVQSAVEGTIQAQKQESKSPSVQSDIDKPNIADTEKIMGDNDLAVIIGIEGYQGIPKSDYSYDDAKLVGDYAKAMGFKPRNIELLLEERATKSAIEKIIKTWLPNKAKPDSRVFIYYSGHGAPEPKTGEAYIVPFDGDPNYLSDTGYLLKSLYDSLGKLQVAEVTVVLDSCFSGAGGRSVLAKGARPLVMMAETSVLSSNMAVLSATQGTQISSSSPEKGHGIFTYYFLKALKDGKKNIAEIYEYIKPLVEDEAKQLNVQQSPSISPDVEKLKGRFGLRK